MRLLQREECQHIAEIIDERGGARRRGNNGYPASTAFLPWKTAGRQAHHVMRDRDRVLILVCGDVPDPIVQVARSISA